MFIPLRHETIPGLCWFFLIHNKVQGKFASCTIVIYLEERSLHWLSQSPMAIACNAHFYIQYKGCDSSKYGWGMLGISPFLQRPIQIRFRNFLLGHVHSFSVETVDTQSRFHSKSKPFCIRMTDT